MAVKILELDCDRGVRVLASMVADPSMKYDREGCERQLAEVDRNRCAAAMAKLISNTEAEFQDRFKTAKRLLMLDRHLALSALEGLAMDPRTSGFARARVAVLLSEESSSAGMRALQTLSRDERVPGFYRVFCMEWSWRTSRNKDRLFELLALASERRLTGRWRVFAAEQLAGIDPDLGLRALAKIYEDRTVRLSWRLRARVMVAIIQRNPTLLASL
jgi:hypothetical protein